MDKYGKKVIDIIFSNKSKVDNSLGVEDVELAYNQIIENPILIHDLFVSCICYYALLYLMHFDDADKDLLFYLDSTNNQELLNRFSKNKKFGVYLLSLCINYILTQDKISSKVMSNLKLRNKTELIERFDSGINKDNLILNEDMLKQLLFAMYIATKKIVTDEKRVLLVLYNYIFNGGILQKAIIQNLDSNVLNLYRDSIVNMIRAEKANDMSDYDMLENIFIGFREQEISMLTKSTNIQLKHTLLNEEKAA